MKHFVKFFIPGSFVSETSIKEINNRNDDIEIPNYVYGYMFYDENENKQEINKTGMYYFGEILTKEDIKLLNINNKYDITLSNMECNDINKIVKTKYGGIYPFKKSDICITKNYYRRQKLKKILK